MLALHAMVPEPAAKPRQLAFGRGLIALGILGIILATLHLANAGYGSSVRRGFGNRRTYDMIKPAVHQAMPRTILLGLGGLLLVVVGGRMGRARD